MAADTPGTRPRLPTARFGAQLASMKTTLAGLVMACSALGAAHTVVAAQAGAPTRLEARPAQIEMRVGESTPLEVVALDAAGQPVALDFRFAAPRAALRVRDGQLSALTAGDYTVVATAVQAPGAAPLAIEIPVHVSWPALAEIRVSTAPGRLLVGTVLRHSARAFHADGSERPEPEVRWSSSNEAVATVDRFGNVQGIAAGSVRIVAQSEGRRAEVAHTVAALAARSLELSEVPSRVRTGDVVSVRATLTGPSGQALTDVPVEWSLSYEPATGVIAPSAPGQLVDGRFVADVPGVYTIVATAGPLRERVSIEVAPREVVQALNVVGSGSTARFRTTDFWVFEGVDGRDYAITGSKRADGHAFMWDVTDPGNIVKTDSIQVDARSVNDVKVSPDGRYATVTREGASNRRNGVVFLDLADPAHPVIASEVTERLTGGVHNAYPTNDYAYALSNGDKYVILDVRDIYDPVIVGEYDHPDSRVHDVWVHDGIAYSAEWGTGVVAVDVGNGRWGGTPENPVYISNLPVPSGGTHAVFPYVSESAGKFYVFIGDEIMSRDGLAWEGPSRARGSYQLPYDPATGMNGIPLATQGYIQVVDFTDPEDPEMVARYEVTEYGTHNIWVEDDVLYQAYYEGGLRVVDVSGELMGNLYTQGREIAVFKPFDPVGYVANSPMVWSAMPHKGHIFFSDTNSGLWAVKLEPRPRPVS